MKKTFPSFHLLLLGAFSFSTSLQAEPWKPDEDAAVFTVCPDQVLGSPYFKEVLKNHGFLEFVYSAIINDRHVVDLQNEIGIQIEDTSEVSFMMGNFV